MLDYRNPNRQELERILRHKLRTFPTPVLASMHLWFLGDRMSSTQQDQLLSDMAHTVSYKTEYIDALLSLNYGNRPLLMLTLKDYPDIIIYESIVLMPASIFAPKDIRLTQIGPSQVNIRTWIRYVSVALWARRVHRHRAEINSEYARYKQAECEYVAGRSRDSELREASNSRVISILWNQHVADLVSRGIDIIPSDQLFQQASSPRRGRSNFRTRTGEPG